jgi:hypothetical protein
VQIREKPGKDSQKGESREKVRDFLKSEGSLCAELTEENSLNPPGIQCKKY